MSALGPSENKDEEDFCSWEDPKDTTETLETTKAIKQCSGFCSTASNGLHHPDLLDCTQYYKCWNGAGELKGCPDGQYFTTKYNGYDHADRVECNVGSTNAPSTSGPIQPPASTAAPTTSGPTQPPVSTAAQTQSPTTQSTPVSCEGGAHYLAHPTDCTKFYQCSHGVAKEIDCPPGLHFSVQHSTCVWPADSECEP